MSMKNLMKQAQKMQAQMARMQEELGNKQVEATAGGGAIRVIANGHKEILEVIIDPAVVDPDDVEMLQDLVLVAVNDALRQADEMTAAAMGKFTGGLKLPF
ncbi:MAG: YbaB/EbfC family nucleoid-associated protein [Firmicutes bacterium]|nr:YbaB/EbfC family nucleoid-associated protein [Bacillota bacterium]